MTSPSRFYLTAAIDYVNGNPHLGHAYEKIGCDMVRRHHALRGRDTRFTVGSDEHSQSVERAAQERGLAPEEFSRQQAEVFQQAFAALDVEYTAYVRTSSEANRRSTDRFMQAMYDGGHIYKGPYEAWFCPSCEQFYTEKQLVEGNCPVHGRPVEWVEEENYFFRLSAFQQPLLEHFEANPGFLTPETRRNEMLNVIRGGLEDISISRSFSHWGFPLPFDESQVVYVWFDALLSYVTGIGYPDGPDFERFWPADVHVIGKDITRFHTVMWPAMLLAAGLPLPRRVHAHGFVTLGGRKMSKSTGVRIDPFDLVRRFGSDAVRYVLMAEVPFDRDGDMSMETFVDRYNADLANDYGNLVSRTEKMVARYFEGRVPEPGAAEPIDAELEAVAAEVVTAHEAAMEALDLSGALAEARRLVARANKYIDETAPWTMAKTGDPRLGTVLGSLLEAIRVSTLLLHPTLPRATAAVAADLGVILDGDAGAGLRTWPALTPGAPVGVGRILFPRLDREQDLEAAGGETATPGALPAGGRGGAPRR
ncbi:MAG: methionyl-tRNA synthetase [Chloroflexi bacterium]|nr:methionyl-tRNA synthetase [Chloroflexota bacterium]